LTIKNINAIIYFNLQKHKCVDRKEVSSGAVFRESAAGVSRQQAFAQYIPRAVHRTSKLFDK